MSDSLLEFPCAFPLKVMGRKDPGFQELVVSLVEPHAGSVDPASIRTRESRDGNFIAVTLTLHVASQAQLDDIYGALSGHDQVLMVL
jgi:uncharacterized protein